MIKQTRSANSISNVAKCAFRTRQRHLAACAGHHDGLRGRTGLRAPQQARITHLAALRARLVRKVRAGLQARLESMLARDRARHQPQQVIG